MNKLKYFTYKLNIDPITIINIWEKDRGYWYMNYYQDCNLSKLEELIGEAK